MESAFNDLIFPDLLKKFFSEVTILCIYVYMGGFVWRIFIDQSGGSTDVRIFFVFMK